MIPEEAGAETARAGSNGQSILMEEMAVTKGRKESERLLLYL
jgi:hypothetical protein